MLDRFTKAIIVISFLIIKEKQSIILLVLLTKLEMDETSSKFGHSSLPIHYKQKKIIGRKL